MKNQKGITLVALVVTIVVLLILAAVSIAMLRGDSGIITNAQKARVANDQGQVLDKMMLAYNTVKTEVKVKEATEVGYSADTDAHLIDLANLVYSDLKGQKNQTPITASSLSAAVSGTGYTVELDKTNKQIKIIYTDGNFADNAAGTAKSDETPYRAIKCTIAIDGNDVTLPGTDNPNRPIQ